MRKCEGCRKAKIPSHKEFCDNCTITLAKIQNMAREACDREGIPYDKTEDNQ